jgi:hypothetical protein
MTAIVIPHDLDPIGPLEGSRFDLGIGLPAGTRDLRKELGVIDLFGQSRLDGKEKKRKKNGGRKGPMEIFLGLERHESPLIGDAISLKWFRRCDDLSGLAFGTAFQDLHGQFHESSGNNPLLFKKKERHFPNRVTL